MQLPGPNGLDVKVSATYSGNVASEVTTWNLDAPTGLLGLGWDLPIDHIAFGAPGSASPEGAVYFLFSQGVSSPLLPMKTGNRDGMAYYEFALKQYQPWRILYFPEAELWEVTQENGITFTYGDSHSGRNTLQWAVRRENWVGHSSHDAGERYPVAWNLSKVKHYWGDTIQFTYESDEVPIGNGGLSYTRASRVASIVDAYGRVVSYRYLPKEPSEYQPPHGRRRPDDPPNGYQDRYEPHYLASVSVNTPAGNELLELTFGYELASVVDCPTGSFIKRYLTSVAQSTDGASAAPSASFSYVNAPLEPDGAPPNGLGSLSSIQYPSGATARYRYGLNELTDRGLAISAPPVGGVPRVWFGPDYVVVTWCSASELVVTAYSWSGCWVPWTSAGSISVTIPDGGASLSVIPSRDFFALTYLDSGSVPALRLYRKNPDRFGSWNIFAPTGYRPADPDASPSRLAVGDRFVVFNPAGSSQLCRYSWNPMSGVWDEQSQTISAARLSIAARANYFVVMAFESGTGTMTLHHHDLVGRWSSTEFPETVRVAAPDAPRFSWSLGASFAIATFIEPDGISESEIRYDVRAYHWDREFSRVTSKYRGSFQSSTALGLPPIATRVAGSLVGNLENVLRYDGSEWQSQTLPCNASQEYGSLFAYGEDVALATDTGGSAAGYGFDADQCALTSIPLEAATPNGSLPPRPTVAGDYLTVGAQVYFRDPTQGWTLMPSSLPSGVNQNSIANRAPAYIAYEVGTGSSAVAGLLLIRNGELHAEQSELLAGQRIFADKQYAPGTILCGENAFVTWSGADFDTARTLHLYHVTNGGIGVQRHCPVIGIDVDDGYGTTSTSYWYDRAVATFDESSTVAQYARVRTFPGVASAPRDGADTGGHLCPNGFTETLFYNGMDPDVPGLFYPGDTANYSSLLNANLLGHKSFDSRGRLVGYQINRYRKFVPSDVPAARALKIACNLESSSIAEAFRLDSEGLVGYLNAGGTGTMPAALSQAFAAKGYVLSGHVTVEVERLYRAWILIDEEYLNLYLAVSDGSEIAMFAGFTRGQRVEYEPRRGFLESVRTVNRNAAFEIEQHTHTITYACEQHDTQGRPVYPAMRDLHILTPIVQETQRVNGIVTGRTLTLYDNQWGYGESCWSARAVYEALDASASFGFDEGSTPDAASWRRTSQVISRNRRGSETESVDVEGVHTSTVYDVNDAIAVAEITNASVKGGECAYFGAEPYERNPGWSIQPGGAAPAVSEGQAHTGTRSILLAPDPTAVLTFHRPNVQPTGGNHRYVFSFRYCTDAGFEDESGDAGVQISVGCGTSAKALPVVPIRGTKGDWQLGLAVIDPVDVLGLDVPPDEFSLEIQAYNHKSGGSLRLDELRLIPLVSQFSGSVVDLEREVEVANLSHTGQALRTVYDAANAPFATTALDGSPVSISATYQSRAGNDNELSALDPSFQLSIAPAGPGVFQDYRRISDWSRFWQGTAGDWEVTGGALAHTASTLDTLTLRESPARGDFGVRLRVRPRAEVTSPLTLAYGDLSIAWIPAASATEAGAWRFGGDASTDVR